MQREQDRVFGSLLNSAVAAYMGSVPAASWYLQGNGEEGLEGLVVHYRQTGPELRWYMICGFGFS